VWLRRADHALLRISEQYRGVSHAPTTAELEDLTRGRQWQLRGVGMVLFS